MIFFFILLKFKNYSVPKPIIEKIPYSFNYSPYILKVNAPHTTNYYIVYKSILQPTKNNRYIESQSKLVKLYAD